MSTTQETSVTSSQDLCCTVEAVEVENRGTKIIGETKAECNDGKSSSTIEELFPWIIEFKKKCRCLLSQPNIVALIKLMKFYARNVSINVNECYTKPYRAAKLKDSISETLLFFLFYFRELVEVCDKNSYLDKMSDLLAMYLDMELKASRRGKEHHSKIAARLTSCLYVYLENSSEHILDTFIKARFVNRNYHDILDPVLTKISKSLPSRPNCDTMYVRYLLIYRLWKKVNNDAAVKNQINTTAISHLGPPPLNPTPFLAKYVLPKVPKSQANSTKFLLLHKFDIEKSCRLFIQYCKENREDEEQGDIDKPNFDTLETLGGTGMCKEAETRSGQLTNAVKTNNNSNSNSSEILPGKFGVEKSITKQERGEISPSKPLRSGKVLPRLKTKKTGDILFIDLTADEITEKVIKKKKQRKLHWLTEVKKKLNTKNIKAAEKKKKTETIASNLSDDLLLSGLVDSTSVGSIFTTTTTAEPSIFSANNPTLKSLSKTVAEEEPENYVTSNFAENESALDQISKFVKKQPICDVTTTVTESIPVISTKEEQILFDPSDLLPDGKVNPLAENSCHTTSERNKIPSSQKPETWTVTELSNALSHICESYDSENSNLDTISNKNPNSKQNIAEINKIDKTDTVESKNIPLQGEEAIQSMELGQDSEKARRCESESSDVAVIFTRRASDPEIVYLDDYAEDNSEIQLEKREEDVVCSSEKSEKLEENSDSSMAVVINNEVKDLTLRTDQLKLTNSLENLSARKDTGRKRSKESDKRKRRNGTVKGKEKTNKPKFNSGSKDIRSIEAVNENETLLMEEESGKKEFKTRRNNLSIEDCDVKKYCDYESSKGEIFDDDKLTTSYAFEIGKKQDKKENEYAQERISIPKINEILICTKNEGENNVSNISNELLTSQGEPQFVENIDGLSLLASVSQHVSHLEEYTEKSLSKPKIIRSEEGEADDSYEVLLDLNVSASGELVNEIELNDGKLNQTDHLKTENCGRRSPDDSLDVVPLILETTVDLNSSTLHNNLISVENVTQMIKESTNVIVNGETVVLFQKSPNSNLYIINKAVDGTMECLADDKKNGAKNIERNSTTMRDIINHIPINLSEKNPEFQEGGNKNHHRFNKNKKIDNSVKKYEKQIISKQFKPIKKEIINSDNNYEEIFTQRCTDTPGSVIELEPVRKSPPPVIRLTDTPVDVKMLANEQKIYREAATGRSNGNLRSNREKGAAAGTSNQNLIYKQNIKQEFKSCANVLPHERNTDSLQTYANIIPSNLQFPISSIQSTKIPHVYNTVTNATSLFNPQHEPCNYLTCGSSHPYQQSVPQSVQNCQLSHCACMKCAYEVHASSSYLQTNSYFISTDLPAKPCAVVDDERELKQLNEAALAKLHDDQLLHNIEQSIIDSKKLNETNVKTVNQDIKKYKPEFENKLPLKKRLKAHAMLSLSYQGAPIKIEKVENYPGTPMMSIAALESRNVQQATSPIYQDKPTLSSTGLELSPRLKDDSLSNQTTEMIRRDYLKDTSLTSIGNCPNVDERVRKVDYQRRQSNSHVNIMGTGCQRSFKTPAQRKEVAVSSFSSPSSLKRVATSVANHPKSPKKGKKAKINGNCRQTRSSKRNIPKVDYSYDGVIDSDTKFNALSELRRKRKKTSR